MNDFEQVEPMLLRVVEQSPHDWFSFGSFDMVQITKICFLSAD